MLDLLKAAASGAAGYAGSGITSVNRRPLRPRTADWPGWSDAPSQAPESGALWARCWGFVSTTDVTRAACERPFPGSGGGAHRRRAAPRKGCLAPAKLARESSSTMTRQANPSIGEKIQAVMAAENRVRDARP